MKVKIFPRKEQKRSEANRIRREGNVPAIVYGHGHENETIVVQGDELRAIFRNLKKGLLPTTIFELQQEGHKPRRAIVKEIHYHPASYAIQHIDFVTVSDAAPVTVNVPINIVGVAECAGIKLGGFLRQILRTLKVKCLPKHLPQEFLLDVTKLDVTQSLKLSDIQIPQSVQPLEKLDQVAVVIAKKAGA